jgi:hypothetical protein
VDDEQLTNGLRGLALAEPPLGFDPDEVATTAARKIRNRRATIGVGLVTLAVLGSAVTFLGPGDTQAPTQVAVPSGPPPVKGLPPEPATDPELLRNMEHLREVLPKLLPGATDITVPDLEPHQQAGMMTANVQFHDDAGPASFNVTITSPKARGHMKKAGDICKPRKSPRCEVVTQPNGDKVLFYDYDSGADVSSYRADGGYIGVLNSRGVSSLQAERYDFKDEEGFYKTERGRLPLNEQQLMQLVTDPAFSIK